MHIRVHVQVTYVFAWDPQTHNITSNLLATCCTLYYVVISLVCTVKFDDPGRDVTSYWWLVTAAAIRTSWNPAAVPWSRPCCSLKSRRRSSFAHNDYCLAPSLCNCTRFALAAAAAASMSCARRRLPRMTSQSCWDASCCRRWRWHRRHIGRHCPHYHCSYAVKWQNTHYVTWPWAVHVDVHVYVNTVNKR